MNPYVVELNFCSPVHFGSKRLSDAKYTCTADTIFSALFIEALAHGSHEELLHAVKSGDLLISDAFPRIEENYYLPKPRKIASAQLDESKERKQLSSIERKAFKNLSYLPVSEFSNFFNGTIDACRVNDSLRQGIGKSGMTTKVMLSKNDQEFSGKNSNPESAFPSAIRKPKPEPYQVGLFSFARESGLYFLVKGNIEILKPLLETLQFSGLGGKRSSGYGRFSFTIKEGVFDMPTIPNNYSMLLSIAAPREDELSDSLLEDSAYSLVKRSGFVQSSSMTDAIFKKRDFFVFSSGSIFRNKFDGDVFNLAQGCSHPVWRYSKAFWLEG